MLGLPLKGASIILGCIFSMLFSDLRSFFPNSGRVNIAVWIYHMDAD